MDEIMNKMGELIKKLLKDPKLQLESTEPLISSGLLDSLNLVDLALMIEDEYGVVIEDFELNADTFDTLEGLAQLIIQRQ